MFESNSGENPVVLYHGSIFLFDRIDTSMGKPFKDFGRGFYTTQNMSHAVNLALRNRRIEEMRLRQHNRDTAVTAYLYKYEVNPAEAIGLSVKEFATADKDWILFVLDNRRSNNRTHTYDIVIGPTANDDTRLSFRVYFSGGYGKPTSEKAINTLIENIEPDNLPRQIYFGSDKGASLLRPMGGAVEI